MTDSFYENLLKATDNTADITVERFGVITALDDGLCTVQEEGNELYHSNVRVLNGLTVKVGDKVVLGFVDNNLYNPLVLGVIGRNVIADIDIDIDNVEVGFDYMFGLSGYDDSLTISPYLKIKGE